VADDPLTIDPALLQLPPGYASTGDPVDGNPFPAGTTRYALWARATRIAEEKIARVKSDWLVSQQPLNDRVPRNIDEMVQQSAFYRQKQRELFASEFHVWAERGGQVVLTDNDVRLMDSWLVGYAEAYLSSNARLMLKHALPLHLVESELRWMRDLLAALVLHYKAESRRCRAIREEDAREFAESSQHARPSTEVTVPHRKPVARTFQTRAKWLARELEIRKWTVQDLERNGGPHAKTTRKILRGERVRETVIEKLSHGLSGKGRVAVADVPTN
jgi:hypothetical protein